MRKNSMQILEHGAIFIVESGLVLTVRVEKYQVKLMMRSHPTWHIDPECVALLAKQTKGTDVLGQ